MRHVYSLATRVCSLKSSGSNPLIRAAETSKSPAIVEALLKAKANTEAKNKVRHLEDSRCAACILIDHACVFVEVRHDRSDAGIIQIP